MEREDKRGHNFHLILGVQAHQLVPFHFEDVDPLCRGSA